MSTPKKRDYLIEKTTFPGPVYRGKDEKFQAVHPDELPTIINGNWTYAVNNKSYKASAQSEKNSNLFARDLWRAVDGEISKVKLLFLEKENSAIAVGGVDFSDSVEVFYILDMNDIYYAPNPHKFSTKFVLNMLIDSIRN